MRTPLPGTVAAVLGMLLTGCGDDAAGPPATLEIEAMSPAANAIGVETGAPVQVRFNQAIDAATLTPASFSVTIDGAAVPAALVYEPATRTARAGLPLKLAGVSVTIDGAAVPAALVYEPATRTARAVLPLMPDSTYSASVTSEVATAGGLPLSDPTPWSFSTRALEAVTVDAGGDVGWWTAVAVDGTGRVHIAYQDRDNSDLKYATCAADCATAVNWQTVTLDAAGTAGYETAIAVDGTGRIHITHVDLGAALEYFTCTGSCTTTPEWTSAVVDATVFVRLTAIAVDAGGAVHVSYQDDTNDNLKYAVCTAACGMAANWQTVTVDAGTDVGEYSSLAVDGAGRVHVGYRDAGTANLKYATCATACLSAMSWNAGTVDNGGAVSEMTGLGVDGSGRVHVAYTLSPSPFAVAYATCSDDCTTATNWNRATVHPAASTPDLALDGFGRVHLAYRITAGGTLGYATCAAECATAANWRSTIADGSLNVGTFASITVDPAGRLHVSYRDIVNDDLKYLE